MYNHADDIALLLIKQLQGDLSLEEQEKLQHWMDASTHNKDLAQRFVQETNVIEWLRQYQQIDLHNVTRNLSEKIPGFELTSPTQYKLDHRVHFLRTAWFRVAVAILMVVGLGTYLWNQHSSRTDDVANKPVPVENDILPGGNKATLTLADGSVIDLDSAAVGDLSQQAGAVIEKSTNGEIVYSFDKTSLTNNVVYNMMSTPRGGTYQLILPDGSKVWLNAESAITFPTAFIGNTREIKMTGEIYFEIKPNKEKPFIVNSPEEKIIVLGTSFNVNAYPDEVGKTSLVEGGVKINNKRLSPGEAYVGGAIKLTNLDQDIAWKNGRFDFSGMSVKKAMEQIGRWYDVSVEIRGNIEDAKFIGSVKRSIPLSNLLAGLEGVEGLHFTVKGKTVIVSK